jgi:hypothetical protein
VNLAKFGELGFEAVELGAHVGEALLAGFGAGRWGRFQAPPVAEAAAICAEALIGGCVG